MQQKIILNFVGRVQRKFFSCPWKQNFAPIAGRPMHGDRKGGLVVFSERVVNVNHAYGTHIKNCVSCNFKKKNHEECVQQKIILNFVGRVQRKFFSCPWKQNFAPNSREAYAPGQKKRAKRL